MRRFACERCGGGVPFAAQHCGACRSPLGYLSGLRTVRTLTAAPDPTTFTVDDHDGLLWRCLNSAWGCNWMLDAGTGNTWCRSCRLTRGRPDEGRRDAIEAWMTAEAAKRRLIYQLDSLGLPVDVRSSSAPDGLAFDLVHLPGEGGITGHLEGVVTLDLAETDAHHRDDLRRRLNEPLRSVIGHLRHEIGHYYWDRFVGQTEHLHRFRELFGDERLDYRAAIEAHYSTVRAGWDAEQYVTGYAGSHPLEDWAETFAHYLHILDATETAAAHDLVPRTSVGAGGFVHEAASALDFDEILDLWRPVSAAANAIAESVGATPVYPFEPRGTVIGKLDFVHQRVIAPQRRANPDDGSAIVITPTTPRNGG